MLILEAQGKKYFIHGKQWAMYHGIRYSQATKVLLNLNESEVYIWVDLICLGEHQR